MGGSEELKESSEVELKIMQFRLTVVRAATFTQSPLLCFTGDNMYMNKSRVSQRERESNREQQRARESHKDSLWLSLTEKVPERATESNREPHIFSLALSD